MARSGAARFLATAAAVALVISLARWPLAAQDGPAAEAKADVRKADVPKSVEAPEGGPTVERALLRPFDFDFDEPTPLDEVARRLADDLGIRVVLDRAALVRMDVDTDQPVQLELEGVRLKTGLKLLLDQVGLAYRVVPEDNLLILTDPEEADEPIDRVLAELKSLHREVHDLQDAVDDVLSSLDFEAEGPLMRKPTIIEEMPGKPVDPPAEKPARSRPGI